MEFKDKLATQRKLKNYSQEQLAELVGVSRQAVSKWETGESYPDMGKIIQLCKLLDCQLSDLLDDDVISEANLNVKNKETEAKEKVLMDYFSDFLDFVTKTYNMFVHMTFKSKIIMLLELSFLGVFLFCICGVISVGISELIRPLFSLFPDNVYYIMSRIFTRIIIAIIGGIGVIVFIHLFKIRYLDYYVTVTDSKVKEQTVEEPINDNKNSSELVLSASPKIVIRDPKHSSSRFIEFLANLVIGLFKLFIVICALPAMAAFVASVVVAVMALVNVSSGNGMVFLFIFVALTGCGVICYLLVHFAYNVVFNRKQPLKIFLIVLFAGLLLMGSGAGLTLNKLATFSNEPVNFKTVAFVLNDIEEGSSLRFWTSDVEYVIDESITGVKIEAMIPEDFTLVPNIWSEEIRIQDRTLTVTAYYFSSYLDYDGPFEALNYMIRHLKEGTVIDFDYPGNLGSVKVRCSEAIYNNLNSTIEY